MLRSRVVSFGSAAIPERNYATPASPMGLCLQNKWNLNLLAALLLKIIHHKSMEKDVADSRFPRFAPKMWKFFLVRKLKLKLKIKRIKYGK